MTSTADHTISIVTVANGGSKSRRAVCSCGFLGVRFAYSPTAVKEASAKAEQDGAEHAANPRPRYNPFSR